MSEPPKDLPDDEVRTFEDLLADPWEQFDPESEILPTILAWGAETALSDPVPPSDLPVAPTPGSKTLRDQMAEVANSAHREWVQTAGGGDHSLGEQIADAVLEQVMLPFITDLPSVSLADPCVECNEGFDPGDRVSWRLRWSPQGLIHEECK